MISSPANYGRANNRKILAVLLAIGLVLSVLVMMIMAEFHEEIGEPYLQGVDQRVMEVLHAHDTPALTDLAFALTRIGSPVPLVPILIVVAVVLWRRQLKDDAVLLMVAMGGAGAIDTVLKLHFKRVRPDLPWALVHEHSFSFPSGHSMGAVLLYGIVTYLLWRRIHAAWQRAVIILAALILIAGIGLSRIYIGVHYPSDVAAGYVVGLLWLLSLIGANEYVERQSEARNGRLHPAPGS